MYLGFSSMNNVRDPAPELLAKTLEEAGFESLWYGEHSHIPVARKTPYPADVVVAAGRQAFSPPTMISTTVSMCLSSRISRIGRCDTLLRCSPNNSDWML